MEGYTKQWQCCKHPCWPFALKKQLSQPFKQIQCLYITFLRSECMFLYNFRRIIFYHVTCQWIMIVDDRNHSIRNINIRALINTRFFYWMWRILLTCLYVSNITWPYINNIHQNTALTDLLLFMLIAAVVQNTEELICSSHPPAITSLK